MKKIGLVGGTGPESTLMYYRELNSRIDQMTNETSMPDLAIESLNFRRAWKYVTEGNYSDLASYISEKVKMLQIGGAEIISLTAVTMHIVIDDIENDTGISMVSIPKAVCEEALKKGYKKVGLLGTIFAMEQDYMKKDLVGVGIDVVIPHKSERELIAKRIYEELEIGIIKETTLNEFNCIMKRMKEEDQIEAVILGCTELPLLLNDKNCILPCLDSVDIHIRKLIELSM